jgi:hypothetical protein
MIEGDLLTADGKQIPLDHERRRLAGLSPQRSRLEVLVAGG